MFVTVPPTLEQYDSHIKLYKSFESLGNHKQQHMNTVVGAAFQVQYPGKILSIRSVVSAVDTDANLHDRNMRREHTYSVTNGYYQQVFPEDRTLGSSMLRWSAQVELMNRSAANMQEVYDQLRLR
ncbi:uncharacterized protein BYT42DRAFT_545471 [Radiomyces spectabilis]|uniref:uncharacterized protein n=1 Tax=Radiomyces spectabilis TaxID=64574 RepID=UPI00221F786A|nr:uncharacterized protein BYT42DRAFT_545471 [Radiomyces spectabilis]KAI8381612.1 hypothetical protein BYT42DRAFT_545471 [Radiomyces spectabilis]